MSLDKKVLEELSQGRASDEEKDFFSKLLSGLLKLINLKKKKYNRILPMGEYLIDRHEKARMLGFGEGVTIYDSVLVIGDVKVGTGTWIGPHVVLDGSGTLVIGNNCSISAGVQIYTHDSIQWAVSGGKKEYEYGPTIIGNNCYIGPNAVVEKNVTVGQGAIIGANSLVNKSVPPGSKAVGSPIKIIGMSSGKKGVSGYANK
jgi:acetyltransferase-like isoleucine patch superfamily enzyme